MTPPLTAAQSTHTSGKSLETILFVDDEKMITEVVHHMLQRLGYSVIVANSGQEALRLYQSCGDTIALVILDVVMPEMDGCETFHRLRDMDPDVRALLCSGYIPDDRAESALSCGCLGFMRKPLTMKNLADYIAAFCPCLQS